MFILTFLLEIFNICVNVCVVFIYIYISIIYIYIYNILYTVYTIYTISTETGFVVQGHTYIYMYDPGPQKPVLVAGVYL